jgi:hypothetical protein
MIGFRERSRYRKAWRLFEEERWSEALAIFDMLSVSVRSNSDVMYARAICLARLGKEEAAEFLCDQLSLIHQDPRGEELKPKIPDAKRAENPPSIVMPSQPVTRKVRILSLVAVCLVIIVIGLDVWVIGPAISEPDLVGIWQCYWGDRETGPCEISRSGSTLTLVNEWGASSRGHVEGDTVFALDWEQELEGRLLPDHTRIEWSNGSVWVKIP